MQRTVVVEAWTAQILAAVGGGGGGTVEYSSLGLWCQVAVTGSLQSAAKAEDMGAKTAMDNELPHMKHEYAALCQ